MLTKGMAVEAWNQKDKRVRKGTITEIEHDLLGARYKVTFNNGSCSWLRQTEIKELTKSK